VDARRSRQPFLGESGAMAVAFTFTFQSSISAQQYVRLADHAGLAAVPRA
jgi:hypothetical protein